MIVIFIYARLCVYGLAHTCTPLPVYFIVHAFVLTDLHTLALSVASAQLSFFGLFVTENAVIDVTVQEMINNIAPFHTF